VIAGYSKPGDPACWVSIRGKPRDSHVLA
jgi:hypothetical protein